MKRLTRLLILVGILSPFSVLAEEYGLKPQTQGDVSFVSGGVGQYEADAMQSVRGDYNLHLLFALQGTGEYLSNVKVNITDAKGNSYLDVLADGPMLFVQLKPGRYTVYADLDGRISHKKVNITGRKPVSLSFLWPH